MRYLLILSCLLVTLASCSNNEESCNQLKQIEAAQLSSRNTISSMNQEHSSDATKSALNDADDAIDEIQRKLIKECGK